MGRRYNPAREYLEPTVTRTIDGKVYNEDGVEMGSGFTDVPGFPMPANKWEEDHERRASHKDSATMSDSVVASDMALTARMEHDRMNTDAEIARIRAERAIKKKEDEKKVVLIDKKNPTIVDILEHNMSVEPEIEDYDEIDLPF